MNENKDWLRWHAGGKVHMLRMILIEDIKDRLLELWKWTHPSSSSDLRFRRALPISITKTSIYT